MKVSTHTRWLEGEKTRKKRRKSAGDRVDARGGALAPCSCTAARPPRASGGKRPVSICFEWAADPVT